MIPREFSCGQACSLSTLSVSRICRWSTGVPHPMRMGKGMSSDGRVFAAGDGCV